MAIGEFGGAPPSGGPVHSNGLYWLYEMGHAALNPARIALPAALVYHPLLKAAYPVVWVLNLVANGLLRLVGVSPDKIASHSLSAEGLRTVVADASELAVLVGGDGQADPDDTPLEPLGG